MKAIFLVLLCALLKLAIASGFPRYIFRLGEPIIREDSPVKANWNPHRVGLRVRENRALVELTLKGAQVHSTGAVLWRMYRRKLGKLIRLPENSEHRANDVLVVILGGSPEMTRSCLEEILTNFGEKSENASAAEIVAIPLIGE
ncbi:hypothetical protein PSACC_00177 [Paramicrosporidium saccamoebae]|uniref:Uncharacterized protein n=1 Tax=Paramicrosporidium saccamoebae TaxID=1246581 RepID=A0A2H9TQH3_9FUNG|nr:hypothetical protein PSACC_00177 [Paramicrosporidium saccamoebae]